MKRALFILVAWLALWGLNDSPGTAQVPVPTSPPNTLIGVDRYIRSRRLGITHISPVEVLDNDRRYRNALLLGAGWNRWPLYWDRVEVERGRYQWAAYDRLVASDVRYRIQTNAILLGRPEFFADGAKIFGLYNPIFEGGSDRPRPDSRLNPDNPWANFVYQAVSRYRPGGILAQQMGWGNGEGITVWEIWNEPDFKQFWSGSVGDYARLLKTAYIVAKWVDPNVKIMFGGLLFPDNNNYLAQVLTIYVNDAFHEEFNWYMDMVAVHSYDYPWRSGWLVRWVKQTLKSYGFSRPVWLNESGAPAWDDYPGPIWAATTPDERRLRTTLEQQAAFVIQSTVYAWAEGAEVVFYHQLYDDCGNQPGGTDFPVHNGELCVGDAICAGDAYGLFRNERDSTCFSQHPFPGTPRPAAAAFRLMAEIFGNHSLENPQITNVGGEATVISFDRPDTGERVSVIWNRTLEQAVLSLPAGAESATLYSMDEDYQITSNGEGVYEIGLPAATPDDFPFLQPGDVTAIGGQPFILIEKPTAGLESESTPEVETFGTPESTPRSPLELTPGSIFSESARPTTDPELDTTPPTATVALLPEVSSTTFTVIWSGRDDGGIDHYLIWVRVNGGEWLPWLETRRTEGQYSGAPGFTYEFAAWAVDLAGNWSTNTELVPQAKTRVE